jgi:hypothetical protein
MGVQRVTDEVNVTRRFKVVDVDPMEMPFSDFRIMPTSASIELDGYGSPRVKVTGSRILKSGKVGGTKHTADLWYSGRDGWPIWLRDAVDGALGRWDRHVGTFDVVGGRIENDEE